MRCVSCGEPVDETIEGSDEQVCTLCADAEVMGITLAPSKAPDIENQKPVELETLYDAIAWAGLS